ncbi:hypothetical protein EBMC1_11830 [Sphingopyxis sp. MC1]|nr:hypothetical protein EBMC1_11830 [Sphingopyxis sp. MC1]
MAIRTACESKTAMFKYILSTLTFLGLYVAAPAHALDGGVTFLVPARDAAGQAITERLSDGRELPVGVPIAEGPFKRRLLAATASGVAALLPDLDRMARARSRQTFDCPSIGGGIIVYLSDEDGGFARKDLFIEDGKGRRALCRDYFIDLTVDEASIADGQFEEVLAHEFGHVLLRRLLGPIPPTLSRNGHSVLVVTDPTTAFDEGFGEHFQPLALALTASEGFRSRTRFMAPSPADYWLSRRETWLRETAIPQGGFLFGSARSDPQASGIEGWRLAQTDYSLDPCSVRTGEAQMASEGVAATIFYRLLAESMTREALLARYEKLFTILARRADWRGRAPLIDLVRDWARLYPEDEKQVTRIFLEATGGATASADLRDATARLSCSGAHGRLADFLRNLPLYRQAFAAATDQVAAGKLALDAHLAPELWMTNPDVHIPAAPWDEKMAEPLVVDLNTADATSLAYLLAGNRDLASRLIQARDSARFSSIDDAVTRAKLTPGEASEIARFHRQIGDLPAFTRR